MVKRLVQPASSGRIDGDGGGIDSRGFRELSQELRLKRAHLVPPGPLREPLRIPRSGKVEAYRDDVRGGKPRIHVKEANEASDEKTGAEDQHHRERDLSHQECWSKPASRNRDCRSQ